jgi:glycosyltransferase involved in cell wall biosynthesis
MNVLLIASRPLDSQGPGDAKMAYWTRKALSGAGHTVSVLVLQPESARGKALHTLRALLAGEPLQLGLTFSAATYRQIVDAAATGTHDIVVAIHARAAAHVPRELRRRGLALLIDAYGQSYRTYAGRLSAPVDLVYRVERQRMDRYEQALVNQFARTAVVSDLDREYLQQFAARRDAILRVSLPVDLEYFSKTRRRADAGPLFAFVGRLNYLPNQDALRWLAAEIWPALRARWPAARLRVIGAGAGPSLRRQLNRPGIELAADVPDIRPHLEDAVALLVPMRMGGGIQVKIVEAMAAGVPVISTRFGYRGLSARAEVLEAEAPDDFARQAARLIDNPRFAEQLAAAARVWVEARHAPGVFEREVLDICAAIAADQP